MMKVFIELTHVCTPTFKDIGLRREDYYFLTVSIYLYCRDSAMFTLCKFVSKSYTFLILAQTVEPKLKICEYL